MSSLFLSLPDDVLFLISSQLSPSSLLSLSLSSRSLISSDKAWLAQCLRLLPHPDLLSLYRPHLPSYLHLFRLLLRLRPLLGLWVHQNPELGNLVSISWAPHSSGSPSLLASRIIPQQLSHNLLFSPVFEIIPSPNNTNLLLFFLHGRTTSDSSSSSSSSSSDLALYPGSVAAVHPDSNVLLLEVTADAAADDDDAEEEQLHFSKLAFGDRRRLLETVAAKVCLKTTPDLDSVPLFPSSEEEEALAAERIEKLVEMHKVSGGGRVDWREEEINLCPEEKNGGKKRSLLSVVKQIIGRTSTKAENSSSTGAAAASSSSSKHLKLREFLKAGEVVGLALRATNMKLTTYQAWPSMHDNRFALYKLPLQEVVEGREYAGLWGGTFGWPPGKTSVDKPEKALFFLLLSYEEVEGRMVLIATKILEGTHYALHPNGSAMFIVRVDEPALDGFPWEMDGDGGRVDVKCSYAGEGIANGYGFRYPGSKPGALFEMMNGGLAFAWKESKAVLTLGRLDLEDMLRKGERVPPLGPIANFVYLTKSYSNVFTGFPGNSRCSPSPR